jgi:hypothetical protein
VSGPDPSTRWLSCHVDYACRHSGACCRSGWPLPVETGVVVAIDGAISSGRLRTIDDEPEWLADSTPAPAGMAGTLRQIAGGCVFHTPASGPAGEGSGRRCTCAVHTAIGHAALPASCQHFPRVCLIDDRGVRVSLSHYCPTAAAMIVDHGRPVTIVDGPPAVPGRATPEGLDVRGQLPPRLTDRVLIDLDGLTAWEARVVAVLAGTAASGSPERAIAQIAADAKRLAGWSPAAALPLGATVAALAEDSRDGGLDEAATGLADPGTWPAWLEAAAGTCRPPWLAADLPPGLAELDARHVVPVWGESAAAVRRYLAAKAFGAWITYQADATVSLAAWLTLCHAVLRIECARACGTAARPLDRELLIAAIRQADLLLVHYADALAIARSLSAR